jgi:hypothetical protein
MLPQPQCVVVYMLVIAFLVRGETKAKGKVVVDSKAPREDATF